MIAVSEIYLSLQGETTRVGLPCVFVRLSGCDLRCAWCDSAFAFQGGEAMSVDRVIATTLGFGANLVTVTGGEPLLQDETRELMRRLLDAKKTVLLETSGAHSIAGVDPRASVILDIKCPASGESDRNLWANIPLLKAKDEVKFVVATREDYEWMKEIIGRHRLNEHCPVVVSWAHFPVPRAGGEGELSLREIAELVLKDSLAVRVLPQVHKVVWPSGERGR